MRNATADDKQTLRQWIEQDRDRLITFFSRLLQIQSPNPPGDTRACGRLIAELLAAEGIACQLIAPSQEKVNVVSSFAGAAPGRHLSLNGHLDVFPAGDETAWTIPPWSGKVTNNRIYGRGACDMKCGTTASVFTYLYLHRWRERLRGRLTLTAVCDEENFGPAGARYLVKHHPEILGDCCLNGEPSSSRTLRFGEKGVLRLSLTVRTPGAHSAYTHLSPSATLLAARLVGDLQQLTQLPVPMPPDIASWLNAAREIEDQVLGQGGAALLQKVSVNIGLLHGGEVINIVPAACTVGVDIRYPPGITAETILEEVKRILARYPGTSLTVTRSTPAYWSDPAGEMAQIIRWNVKALQGFEPAPIISLGGSDLRLWRERQIPAYYYGPTNHGMGTPDEYVEIDEFLHVVRTHLLSAYDYLQTAPV